MKKLVGLPPLKESAATANVLPSLSKEKLSETKLETKTPAKTEPKIEPKVEKKVEKIDNWDDEIESIDAKYSTPPAATPAVAQEQPKNVNLEPTSKSVPFQSLKSNILPTPTKIDKFDDDFDISLSSDEVMVPVANKLSSPSPAVAKPMVQNPATDKGKTDSFDDFDSASSKKVVVKASIPLYELPKSSQSILAPKNETLAKESLAVLAQEMDQKLEASKKEIITSYNKRLSAFQDQKEKDFELQMKKVLEEFQSGLERTQNDAVDLIKEEMQQIQSKMTVQMTEIGPLVSFPPKPISEFMNLLTCLEKQRSKFETNLKNASKNLSEEYAQQLEIAQQSIQIDTDSRIAQMRTSWMKDGEKRIQAESDNLVKQQAEQLEALHEKHRLDYHDQEKQLLARLNALQVEVETKIQGHEIQLRQLDVEMAASYAEKQKMWDQKFEAMAKTHLEHEEKLLEIQKNSLAQAQPIFSTEKRSSNENNELIDARQKILEEKETAVATREQKVAQLEESLNQKQKNMVELEALFETQKRITEQQLEAKKLELDKQALHIAGLQEKLSYSNKSHADSENRLPETAKHKTPKESHKKKIRKHKQKIIREDSLSNSDQDVSISPRIISGIIC